MASRLLDVTLKLSSTHPINGLLTLDETITAALTYDDTEVTTNTITVASVLDLQIYADAGTDGTVYVYLKNTDTTNFIVIKNDAGNPIGRVNAGEFAFLPVNTNEGLEVQADTSACVVEFITLKKA